MVKWTFEESFNVHMRMDLFANVNVLGQVKNVAVATGYLLFRNINFGLLADMGEGREPELYAFSKAGETVTIEDHMSYAYGAASWAGRWGNDVYNHGLSAYDDNTNYIKFINVNYAETVVPITNIFFDYGTLKNKAIDKKMIFGAADSLVLNEFYFTFNSLQVYDNNGNSMGITHGHITFDIPTGGIYTDRNFYSVSGNPGYIDAKALRLVSEAFPETYTPNGKG